MVDPIVEPEPIDSSGTQNLEKPYYRLRPNPRKTNRLTYLSIENYPAILEASRMKEMSQHLEQETFLFKSRDQIPGDEQIVDGFMFDVDKFDAAGNYTKTKSRYVARGDQEFGTKIDISAPTCSLQRLSL